MSGGPCSPRVVRVPVPADPALVRVPVPATPSVIRVPGSVGLGAGAAAIDVPGTGAVALSGHRAVCADADGRLIYASADLPGTADAFVGVTTGAAAAGQPITARAVGEMEEPSWTWTPGAIFLGSGGALTQVEPTAGVILVVATALSATRILINPDRPIFLGA